MSTSMKLSEWWRHHKPLPPFSVNAVIGGDLYPIKIRSVLVHEHSTFFYDEHGQEYFDGNNLVVVSNTSDQNHFPVVRSVK